MEYPSICQPFRIPAFIDNPTLLIRLVPTLLLLFYTFYIYNIFLPVFPSQHVYPWPMRKLLVRKYADWFPLRSLFLSLSRGSIDKLSLSLSPPNSIIFPYFIFFLHPIVILFEEEARKFQRNSHFPTFCWQAFSRQESSPSLIRLVDSSYFRILSALLHLVRLENIVARKRRLLSPSSSSSSSFSKPAYTEPSGNSFTGREDPASIMTLNISNRRSTRKMFASNSCSYVVYTVCITDYRRKRNSSLGEFALLRTGMFIVPVCNQTWKLGSRRERRGNSLWRIR